MPWAADVDLGKLAIEVVPTSAAQTKFGRLEFAPLTLINVSGRCDLFLKWSVLIRNVGSNINVSGTPKSAAGVV